MNTTCDDQTSPSPAQLRTTIDDVLSGFLAGRLERLEDHEVRAVFAAAADFILSGGKRIRPILCYWGWRGARERPGAEIFKVAAALEIFHACCLIQDDIVDGSELRRGRPTLHRLFADRHAAARDRGDPQQFGVATAILLGDLCMTWADELLCGSGLDASRLATAYRHHNRMRSELLQGQYLDVLAQARGPSLTTQPMTIARYKTAKYTAEHPLRLGGVLAGASSALVAAYSDFGLALGEAFQLRDDILGAFGDPAVTGKPAIDDFRQGKATMLIDHALRHAGSAQRRLIDSLHGCPELDEDGAHLLREVLRDTGALTTVENMIDQRGQRALATLDAAPIHPAARQALADLTTTALHRTA